MTKPLSRLTWTALVLGSALALGACGDKASDAKTGGTPEAAAAAEAAKRAAEEGAPRQAKFDPNLQPRNVVWDDPVKQKEWEARQRAKAAGAQAPARAPAQAPAQTPVQPAAAPAAAR